MELRFNNGITLVDRGQDLLTKAADKAAAVRREIQNNRNIMVDVCGYRSNDEYGEIELRRVTQSFFDRFNVHELVARVTIFADGREEIEMF